MSITKCLAMDIKTANFFILSYYTVICKFTDYSLSTAWSCKSLADFSLSLKWTTMDLFQSLIMFHLLSQFP